MYVEFNHMLTCALHATFECSNPSKCLYTIVRFINLTFVEIVTILLLIVVVISIIFIRDTAKNLQNNLHGFLKPFLNLFRKWFVQYVISFFFFC